MSKGKLIVIEGLDGAGIQTQARLLVEYLKAKGQEVIYTSEPTSDNPVSKLIRQWLDKKFELNSDEAITLLYIADRYEHLAATIIPALESGKTVVCDRYLYSTLAYEGGLFGVDTDWIKQAHSLALKPHLKFFIDTTPEECIKRLGSAKSRLERLETLQKVSEFFKKVLREDRGFYIINGNRSRAEVFEDIKRVVDKPDSFFKQQFNTLFGALGPKK